MANQSLEPAHKQRWRLPVNNKSWSNAPATEGATKGQTPRTAGEPSGVVVVPRLTPVDIARGVAVLAMVGYHLCWDLSFLGLAGFDIAAGLFWIAARTAILSAFLALAGVALVLAHGAHLRLRPALWRTLILTVCAGAVSAASFWLFPESPIFFGVLHLMAAGGLLGLAFVSRAPLLALGVALAMIGLPAVYGSPLFASPWLIWIGLGATVPDSNDYVPLFPWFGVILIGIAAARVLRTRGVFDRPAWRAPVALPVPRALAWAGRRSLAIYLLHQPALLGLLVGGLWLGGGSVPWLEAGRAPASGSGRFLEACRANCQQSGGAAGACAIYCTCADTQLNSTGITFGVNGLPQSAAERERMMTVLQACAVTARYAPVP